MPALKNLQERITANDEWSVMYRTNKTSATQAKDNIPLIHVTKGTSFVDMVAGDQMLQPSVAVGRSEKTIIAQEILGLPPSLYFYAGRACPDFGNVALAFDFNSESGHTGSATPFDSGGLAGKYILWDLPDYSPERLREFIRDSLIELCEWRREFAEFIAAYFTEALDYWSARPCMPDPEGIYLNVRNMWRAWVFEVRFYDPINVCNRVAWCASRTLLENLRVRLARYDDESLPIGSFETPLQRFLRGPSPLNAESDLDVCETIERWAEQKTTTI